jgi:signal transduction histidine kinase
VVGLRLRSAENAIQFEFASLNFDVDESIRFQYKLEGSRQGWSAPTESRSVDYASLSSGSYRFLVRAVNSEGLASEVPASVGFVILPPIWQQWWFVGLLTAAICTAVVAAHRYRVQQLLELERVRTRIATDLHDDVGSSLTQIAILSEVARRNGSHVTDGAEPLERIADLSRGLVDSMSDIVWSINPQRDHLRDLESRMRRFASDVLAPRDIDFELTVSAGAGDIGLDAEVRRHLYLVFKESIHNSVRHANCRQVRATLETRGRLLTLRVTDDGKGLPLAEDAHGHGIANMRRRAAAAGGQLGIESEPGRGTSVTIQVSIDRAAARSRAST